MIKTLFNISLTLCNGANAILFSFLGMLLVPTVIIHMIQSFSILVTKKCLPIVNGNK